MEQRKERCEGVRNVLVDSMHRRNHRHHLQDLANRRPSSRHRYDAAAVPVPAVPFAGVSSPSYSACSLCPSYSSSLGVAVDWGSDGVAVGGVVAGGVATGGVAAGGVAVGLGPGGVADAWVNLHELKRKLHRVAADSGGVVAACADSAQELKRVIGLVAAESESDAAAESGAGAVVVVVAAAAAAACADSALELEHKLALVAAGMLQTWRLAAGTTVDYQIAAEALVHLRLAAGNNHQYLGADWQRHTVVGSWVIFVPLRPMSANCSADSVDAEHTPVVHEQTASEHTPVVRG